MGGWGRMHAGVITAVVMKLAVERESSMRAMGHALSLNFLICISIDDDEAKVKRRHSDQRPGQ